MKRKSLWPEMQYRYTMTVLLACVVIAGVGYLLVRKWL